ncbi:MAG: type III-B CRISPR module RAMP protein Cmr4 [Thermoactinomyces sp.]
MLSRMVGLLAETFIHPGQGKQQGIIDQPVARESWTDYPFIPGSAVKGAFKDKAAGEGMKDEEQNFIFGTTAQAGAIGFSDARLLLLPIRSLNHHYYWVTCPYILERFVRDLALIGELDKRNLLFDDLKLSHALIHPQAELKELVNDYLYLEEFNYSPIRYPQLEEIITWIKRLVAHNSVQRRLKNQVVVISDAEFRHFARFGLPIQSRNQLEANKISKNVWQEENLPPDSLLYTLLIPRYNDPKVQRYYEELSSNPYLQIGGNESTGHGWFVLRFWATEGEK